MDHDLDEGPGSADLDRFAGDTGYCPGCGAEIWDDAPWCPACGENPEGGVRAKPHSARTAGKVWAAVLLMGVVIGLILAVLFATPW